ncbi:unnamed protein product [Gongylonema pulchrum]|uniref:Uncharacterized protein n=1 Tax=Gongylonema pulchrum TaxID=637853 RepID=A0A183EJL0_9BILA|nr:unnamed protein product [Gongylonema pulchrum]
MDQHKERPSALGHFLSRIGSIRSRNRSPRESAASKQESATSPGTQLGHSVGNGTKSAEGTLRVENGVHLSPPSKTKRNSLPFVRLIHRLSMSRKSRETRPSSLDTHNASDLVPNSKLNSSFETVVGMVTRGLVLGERVEDVVRNSP